MKLANLRGLWNACWFAVVFSSGCSRTDHKQAIEVKGAKPERTSLVLYSWDDYCSLELLDRFEKETGIHVDYQKFEEPEEVEAKLRSDPRSIDVLVVDSFNLNKLRQLRLLRELDKSKLPNLQHMGSEFLNQECDPGNSVSVPYQWGTTLIAYRKDRIPEPARSWNLLWDPRYKGHVMMLDDSFEALAMTLILHGRPVNTLDPKDYELAERELLSHLEKQQARYLPANDLKEALVSGEVWAAMCYSGDAAFAAEKDDAIDFFVPKEGATKWIDSLGVARDTQVPEAAHRFLNFMMDPAVAALNGNFLRFATPNLAATALLDPELRNDERIYPPEEVLARCTFLPQLDAERDALVNRHWHAIHEAFTAREEDLARREKTADARQ
jgi:spermidine/putrescine transport system substrate-binding protein